MKSCIEKLDRILYPYFEKKDATIASFLEIYADRIDTFIRDADAICRHEFSFLGMQKLPIGEKIDWQKDFKSGYEWDNRIPHKDIKYGYHFSGNADVIIPWQLSRFHHLITLGKIYWVTSEEKYTEEFVKQIADWSNSNPVNFGVNWVSPMDVGIRAVNWIIAYHFFCKSELVSDSFDAAFVRNLISHAEYLMKNIKRTPNNNHRIAGFVGLLYIGLFLSELRDSRKWVNYGIAGLIKGMKEQVYKDGVNYEGAICYHRLVAEMFLSVAILCRYNNIYLPDSFLVKLEKMLEFIANYTMLDGKAPQIGDNDDGRLHILSNYYTWDRNDHRYLLSAGAVMFNRADFARVSGRFCEESFWLLGNEGHEKFSSLINKEDEHVSTSKIYQNGGYYIMRDSELYMIVDCLPFDRNALTGHRHNSRLSFEIFAYNKSFIVDPGAYVYTSSPQWRNKFRSTSYHNTAIVDKTEQNDFVEGNLFWTGNEARVKVNNWESNAEYDLLDVQHSGYQRLKETITHRREFLFNKRDRYWIIIDNFSGKGKHRYEILFHFAPVKVETHPEDRFSTRTICADDVNICVVPLSRNGISVTIYPEWMSRSYGIKEEAPVLEIAKEEKAPQQFITLIYPFRGKDVPSISSMEETAYSFLNKHLINV